MGITRILAILAAIFGLGGATFGTVHFFHSQNGQNGSGQGHVSGAPGPIAGAGLPLLAVGYGVYWLIKRRRKAD